LAVTVPSPLIRNMRVGLGFLRYSAHTHRSHIDHTVSTHACVTTDAPTRLS
jgi:hypothetical protein